MKDALRKAQALRGGAPKTIARAVQSDGSHGWRITYANGDAVLIDGSGTAALKKKPAAKKSAPRKAKK